MNYKDNLRIFTAGSILFVAFLCTIFGVEKYPFSNYPMYSNVVLSSQRLTFISVDSNGVESLLGTEKITPVGRIHLGFLLRKYIDGNSKAKTSVHKMVNGILANNNNNIKKIHISLVKIILPQSNDVGFSYSVEKTLKIFDRSNLIL